MFRTQLLGATGAVQGYTELAEIFRKKFKLNSNMAGITFRIDPDTKIIVLYDDIFRK